MIVGLDNNDDKVILPFSYQNNLITYEVQTPTEEELTTLPVYALTSDLLWDPQQARHDLRYDQTTVSVPILHGENINPSHTNAHAIISCRIQNLHKINATKVYGSVDPELLKKTMMIPTTLVAQKTLDATTQLGKMSKRYPLQSHLKSRNPQLNWRRQNEAAATDHLKAAIGDVW